MSNHKERPCAICGSLLHHENECKTFRREQLQSRITTLLSRLEEARRLLSQHKELAHEVVAFGNCDCNIPKGETCIPCQFAMLNKATNEWLKGQP